ncbi:MAG: MFS transporter [Firmicutes bacterium]|nr:MFS transporter [Bacillota bacterium]MCL5014191.1 MFS transporter [Bacillota bacterium]
MSLSKDQHSPPRQRWARIIPVAFLMYTISFMDRINIGFGFSGMEKTLGISATVAGLAGGIFFFGYLFLQIPGGYLGVHWSAKKFVTIALIIWGIFAVLTGAVQNTAELLLVRFFLGVAEGGVWPATLALLAKWFPLDERARANSYWMFCLPVAAIIMSPFAGFILAHLSWRWLFYLEGLPAFIWAVVWWIFIDESPEQARWISPEERAYLQEKFAEDAQQIRPAANNWRQAFANGQVWLLVLVYFLALIGLYGVSLWLPTILKNLSSLGPVGVGLLGTLPYIVSVLALWLNSRHSDATGERKMHIAVPLVVAGIALLISAMIGRSSPVWAIVFISLTEAGVMAFLGVFWTLPPMIVGKDALGASMGLINGLGNLGGFVGPFMVGYLLTVTHNSIVAGLTFMTITLVLGGLLILRVRYVRASVHIPSQSVGG